MIDKRAVSAARNNAEWCEAMCRAHGLSGVLGARAWTSGSRTPLLYPDAVTLTEDATADDVLDAVSTGPGCSVKDSFATLDLSGAGFHVLFEAQWLHREPALPAPAAPDGVAWSRLDTPAELAEWAAAWGGGDGPAHLFRPELLSDPSVAFLAGRVGDRLSAGAVVSRGGDAVGISNLFAADGGDLDAAWAGCLSTVYARWPGVPVVGYEQGDDLAAAVRQGCVPVGPLRVWLAG
ncbi:hypothetical protein RKD22_002683 [Streptomyces pristinaespiralis]